MTTVKYTTVNIEAEFFMAVEREIRKDAEAKLRIESQRAADASEKIADLLSQKVLTHETTN